MEELIVVLNRRDDPSSTGLGFSLLDKPGFPPVIYDIEENSPAAESGKVILPISNLIHIVPIIIYGCAYNERVRWLVNSL